MALDLSKVAPQVVEMVARLKSSREEQQMRLASTVEALHKSVVGFEALRQKVEDSNTTWLVAGIVEKPDRSYKPPAIASEFTVMASDGSQIDVDRHHSIRCYLINISGTVIRYGAVPRATLESRPALYANDDDMVIASPGGKVREQPVEGSLLGIKRSVEECGRLAKLAAEHTDTPTLALLDGSLILWGLEAYPDFVTDVLLYQGFLANLDRMRKPGDDRRLALASYISLPRSTDVVNALKVSLCPRDIVDSDRFCPECPTRQCEAVAGVRDRELFANILEPGERSALFASRSSVVKKHYGEHRVHFFYLHLDGEIARVEIPQWVARNPELLDLTHALVLDQCARGHGYPVALSEAHEQAVITGADRESFWRLVESLQAEEHLPVLSSAKSFSKRTRWV